MRHTLTPAHDDLRRAIQWLAECDRIDAKTIEEASVRFDLSPDDEQFLLTHFGRHQPAADASR